MKNFDFPVASADALLLLALSETDTLRELALRCGKDMSVLSRSLLRLSRDHGLTSKIGNRWELTARGRQVAFWARRALKEMGEILAEETRVTLCASRELTVNQLLPRLHEVKQVLGASSLELVASHGDVESLLLAGKVDLAIACGAPASESLSLFPGPCEPYAVVVNRQLKREIHDEHSLAHVPYVKHVSLSEQSIFPDSIPIPVSRLWLGEIGLVKEAILQGLGWGILPLYCMERELAESTLFIVSTPSLRLPERRLNVWGTSHKGRALALWLKAHMEPSQVRA